MRRMFWSAEELLVFREELCCLELTEVCCLELTEVCACVDVCTNETFFRFGAGALYDTGKPGFLQQRYLFEVCDIMRQSTVE